MHMIELKDLHKSYGNNEIIKGVDLSVEKSEVVVVIGPSGSGKSTLLRCVNYLEVPTSGSVSIDGEIINRKSNINTIRAEVGMVFQHFNLFPHMTVGQNITLAPINVRHQTKAEAEKIARDLLERVGLADKIDAFPDELSGGQQQRVAIARAVVANPKLILADEPTGNLDSKNGQEVMNLLSELNKEGTTIVMVTHSQHDAGFASRTINLFDGQVVTETLI